MGPKRVMWVRRYQGQCRALQPLGHQGYRLRSYNKDQPLCSGYIGQQRAHVQGIGVPDEDLTEDQGVGGKQYALPGGGWRRGVGGCPQPATWG